MKRLAWLIVLLVPAGVALADPPQKAAHVDPGAPCFRWPAVDMDGDGVFDRIDHCPNTPAGCAVDKWGCSLDSDGDGVCDGLDKCPDTPKGETVDQLGCSKSQLAAAQTPPPPPPAPPREERPVPVQPPPPAPAPEPQPTHPASEAEKQLVEKGQLRLENVYFETASARLLPESETTLSEAGAALQKYPDLKIEVQGHTDTRGGEEYNRRLSQSRAESVRAWLLEHYRLRAENLVAHGYGKSRPETHERNDEELLRNRRVVLKVLNPGALPHDVEIAK